MKKFILGALFLLGLCALGSPAQAANCNAANGSCFWIGGTGTLDFATDSAHWSNTTGGTTCSCEPAGTAALTFDGSSGGGTVTINTNITLTGTSSGITAGAFTGTLDWSANNNNVSVSLISFTGAGARTINLGNGTWTLNCQAAAICWSNGTVTSETLNANSSTIIMQDSVSTSTNAFAGGGKTYNNLTFSSTGASYASGSITGANTFATLTLNGVQFITFPASTTTTVTTLSCTNTSSTVPIFQSSTGGTRYTISQSSGTPTCTWVIIRDGAFTGGATFTANNSINFGNNTGITINAPGGTSGFAGLIGGGI